MKQITIEKAERLIDEGKDVLNIKHGFITHMDQSKFNNIKNIITNIPSYKNAQIYFYAPDDTKDIYTLKLYYDEEEDGEYYTNNNINFSYYETYDNMRNIFKNIVDKFLMDKFNLSLSDLNCNTEDKHELRFSNDRMEVYLSLGDLTCNINLYNESNDYFVNVVVSKLKDV